MRKFVSLGAVLLFVSGFAFLAQPTAALPICECEFCSFSPNSWCWEDQFGFRLRCYEYTSLYCFGMSASATEKAASVPEAELFPLDFLGVPVLDQGRLYLPLAKPGC